MPSGLEVSQSAQVIEQITHLLFIHSRLDDLDTLAEQRRRTRQTGAPRFKPRSAAGAPMVGVRRNDEPSQMFGGRRQGRCSPFLRALGDVGRPTTRHAEGRPPRHSQPQSLSRVVHARPHPDGGSRHHQATCTSICSPRLPAAWQPVPHAAPHHQAMVEMNERSIRPADLESGRGHGRLFWSRPRSICVSDVNVLTDAAQRKHFHHSMFRLRLRLHHARIGSMNVLMRH